MVELTYQFSGGIRVQPYQSYTLVLHNVGGRYYLKATRIKADYDSDMGYTCIYTPDALGQRNGDQQEDITLTRITGRPLPGCGIREQWASRYETPPEAIRGSGTGERTQYRGN